MNQNIKEKCDEISHAIINVNMIKFIYEKKIRIGEPHVLGITKDNKYQILLWQTEGDSKEGHLPNWRKFNVSKMLELEILEENFGGSRGEDGSRGFKKVINYVK